MSNEKNCFGHYDDASAAWWCLGCVLKKDCENERDRRVKENEKNKQR